MKKRQLEERDSDNLQQPPKKPKHHHHEEQLEDDSEVQHKMATSPPYHDEKEAFRGAWNVLDSDDGMPSSSATTKLTSMKMIITIVYHNWAERIYLSLFAQFDRWPPFSLLFKSSQHFDCVFISVFMLPIKFLTIAVCLFVCFVFFNLFQNV